jgi:putative ABC transport system ATP-binding protein
VLALLDRLTRQAGKNLIMVTHSAEAASFADRVLTLHEGHLEEDPHE